MFRCSRWSGRSRNCKAECQGFKTFASTTASTSGSTLVPAPPAAQFPPDAALLACRTIDNVGRFEGLARVLEEGASSVEGVGRFEGGVEVTGPRIEA